LVSAILVRLAGSLKRLSDDEWAAVHDGAFGIVITTDVPASAPRRSSRRESRPNPDSLVAAIVARLNQAADREAATQALTQPGTTNDVLRGVARSAGVHMTSKDTKPVLIERIVESTIGFRLRARAIQGDGLLLDCRENSLAP
jgi:hypothetical protein